MDLATKHLSPKQLQSIRESVAAVNIWSGSVRSGKTISSLLAWLMYLATHTGSGEQLLVGRTRDSIARNVISPLQNPDIFGPLASQVHYTAGAPTANILGVKVWVLGTSDVKSEKILRGLTCAGAYVDELTLIQEDFFVQLLNRMWDQARLFATTNPDNPAHWFKVSYLDRLKELPDWRHWHFVLDDNPVLTEDRKDRIRRENTGLFYRRFVLGEWVAAEGSVFDMWDPDYHVVTWDRLPVMERMIAVGIDYGTQNATSAILLALTTTRSSLDQRADDQKLVLLDEWRYDARKTNRRLTDGEQSRAIVDWINGPHQNPRVKIRAQGKRVPFTIVDPSAASLKVQLQRDGAQGVTDADNDVLYGVRTMASLLNSGKLLVADRCAGFIQEVPGYSWDPKAAEKGEDKPLGVADHSLDAARYAITTTENIWRGIGISPSGLAA